MNFIRKKKKNRLRLKYEYFYLLALYSGHMRGIRESGEKSLLSELPLKRIAQKLKLSFT